VYVIKADKTAELRPVVVERVAGNDAVISKGLAEGEVVVVEGQLRVLPGKPVEIKEPAGTASPGGDRSPKGKGKSKEKDPAKEKKGSP
jgi:multidrug efflux system membrane fusion protein